MQKGKFEINEDKSGQFSFVLKSGNKETLLSNGESYTTLAACEEVTDSIRVSALDDNCYEHNTGEDGNLYFSLKDHNGKIIGTSEMYGNKAAMEKGIAAVKQDAPKAFTMVSFEKLAREQGKEIAW